jgi:hypothetical protein
MTYHKSGTNTPVGRHKTVALYPVLHARAKVSAAVKGQNLQEWFAEAVQEKLAREGPARKAGGAA